MVWGCCGMYIEVLGFRFRLLSRSLYLLSHPQPPFWFFETRSCFVTLVGLELMGNPPSFAFSVLWLHAWLLLPFFNSAYEQAEGFFFFWLGMFWCNTMRRTIAIKKIKMIWHFCFETGTFINSVCVLELEIRTLYIQGITV